MSWPATGRPALLAVAVVAVVAGLATACSPGADPQTPPAVAEPPVEVGPSVALIDLGEDHVWPSGDTMTVSSPVPADVPAGPGYARVLVFDVTVTPGQDGRRLDGYRVVPGGEGRTPPVELPGAGTGAPAGPQAAGEPVTWTVAVQVAVTGQVELELAVVDTTDEQQSTVFYRGAA